MSNFLIILKKELLDIVRDKKTIVFTLILPILLYPIMFKFMSSSMEKTQSDVQKEMIASFFACRHISGQMGWYKCRHDLCSGIEYAILHCIRRTLYIEYYLTWSLAHCK